MFSPAQFYPAIGSKKFGTKRILYFSLISMILSGSLFSLSYKIPKHPKFNLFFVLYNCFSNLLAGIAISNVGTVADFVVITVFDDISD